MAIDPANCNVTATGSSWPGSALSRDALGRTAGTTSDFSVLGNLESVVDLDAEVPHRAFELRMAK